MIRSWAFALFAGSIALAGCSQTPIAVPPAEQPPADRTLAELPSLSSGPSSKIAHVVVIVQENRTTNNLFNGFPGADTTRIGKNSHGQPVQLEPELLTAPFDIRHSHKAFKIEYAHGGLDGFDRVPTQCAKLATCPPAGIRAYSYVPQNEVQPYFDMASRYTFANRMFQTNEGPSFPAHQYILSGTSTISNGSSLRAAENATSPVRRPTGGCDAPPGSFVKLIDPAGRENQRAFPCFYRISLIQLIEAQGLSWHYYQAHLGAGIWEGPDAIAPVRYSQPFSKNVVAPPAQVLNDIAAGNLANVVWITPTPAESDHALATNGSGPSWVASVVNAIGESQYWNDTVIFVTWDDWGGWYDQIVPPSYNSYELSFRVPLIVISAFAKQHYISSQQHEFGSILKFTEETFGLGSLGTTDVRSDDLSDCFDFSQPPNKFVPIPAPYPPSYFLKQPISMQDPDDD